MTKTHDEDKAQQSGAEVVDRGGPITAFLAVLLYAAILGALPYLNLAGGADTVLTT